MSDYANMTAAELREVVRDLPTGFKWPCFYGLGDRHWHDHGSLANLTIPEAAAMLERACIEYMTSHGYTSTKACEVAPNVYSSCWRKEGFGLAYTGNEGPTPLHAIVKAVEAVGKAGEKVELKRLTGRAVLEVIEKLGQRHIGRWPVVWTTDGTEVCWYTGENQQPITAEAASDLAITFLTNYIHSVGVDVSPHDNNRKSIHINGKGIVKSVEGPSYLSMIVQAACIVFDHIKAIVKAVEAVGKAGEKVEPTETHVNHDWGYFQDQWAKLPRDVSNLYPGHDVYAGLPERVASMTAFLEKYVTEKTRFIMLCRRIPVGDKITYAYYLNQKTYQADTPLEAIVQVVNAMEAKPTPANEPARGEVKPDRTARIIQVLRAEVLAWRDWHEKCGAEKECDCDDKPRLWERNRAMRETNYAGALDPKNGGPQ